MFAKGPAIPQLRAQNLFSPLDLQLAGYLSSRCPEHQLSTAMAAALVSRQTGLGHICLDLKEQAGKPVNDKLEETLLCPGLTEWLADLSSSPVIGPGSATTPLVLEGTRLYLRRYYAYEQELIRDLKERSTEVGTAHDPGDVRAALARYFEPETTEPDWQRTAAFASLTGRFCIISGGPGTGKTTTVAKILAVLLELAGSASIKVRPAAPTGKAAARLTESLRSAVTRLKLPEDVAAAMDLEATTIHRLLGVVSGSPYFRADRDTPLDADLVIVDEVSMVDLPLMAKLVRAVPPHARLILLGDKDQLASVEAGSVMADICGTGDLTRFSPSFVAGYAASEGYENLPVQEDLPEMADRVVQLQKTYRFSEDSSIRRLSDRVRLGDARGALEVLSSPGPDLTWVEPESGKGLGAVLERVAGEELAGCLAGNDPMTMHDSFGKIRILTAVRKGERGLEELNRVVEELLRRQKVLRPEGRWYPGRPIMIARNDYTLNVYNGDVGITVRDEERNLRVAFPGPDSTPRLIAPVRLPEHETVFAMTVHKSQGSEFDTVILVLPDTDVLVLTRELLYTGITRARSRVVVIGSREMFMKGVGRKVERSSGLREGVWG